MRLLAFLLSLIAFLDLSGCADSLKSEPPPAKWTTGFWFWQGSSTDVSREVGALDVLFLQAGTIYNERYRNSAPWSVRGQLPDDLPAARAYWLVFSFELQRGPDLPVVPLLANQCFKLREEDRQRG